MPSNALSIISLFCGAGGLDVGFRSAGFRVALACDNSQAAISSYNANCKRHIARVQDLAKATPKDLVRLLNEASPGEVPVGIIGGPPCQGFSRGNAGANPSDPRNLLPFSFANTLAALNKRFSISFFLFENVMGLLTPRHAPRFNSIRRRFRAAGFKVFHQTLNASDFGVAQNRPRLFIVGLNSRLYPEAKFKFPIGAAEPQYVRGAIAGLPKPAYFRRGMTVKDIPYHPNHWTMVPKSRKLTGDAPAVGRSFRRLAWDEVCPTIAYGNREIHVHPDGGRRLSVYEAMLLQGFPERYRLKGNFSEQITQVSNAVPPPLARALARTIRTLLLRGNKE